MAFATENFAVISGDFRRTHIDDENIYYDDTLKVFSINPGVLGGFTGDCDVSKYLIHELKSISDKATVEAVSRFIKKKLKCITRKDMHQTVILTGASDSGKMAILKITHRDGFKVGKIIVKPNEIKWLYAFPSVDPGEYIDEYYDQITDCNYKTISELAEKVNKKASETDNCVSSGCKIISILNK
ncbi:MAG: hypothetical protein K0S80_1687 [Neobacillus sp.]|jgi:hypothetical protein|nr:hypothetical protein [Neobacillus sp.]